MAGGEKATLYSGTMNTLGHAAVGCASAEAMGGDCGKGAITAGVSAGIGNAIGGYNSNIVIGSIEAGAVGGLASLAGGSSFAEGAKSGAFGYLFNHWAHNLALAMDGIEAHQTLQREYGWRQGYEVEAGEIPGVGSVDGRFDIARSDGSLWEIKRNSDYGRALGERALDAYTDGTGFRRGDDLPGLPVGGTMILDGTRDNGIYKYTNMGNGLIVYDRIGTQPSRPITIPVPTPIPLPSPGRRPYPG